MVKITLQDKVCLVEPQGPLTKDDFVAIASQVDPVIENEGKLEGLIIKTRDFPGWESFAGIVEHFRFVKNHHQVIKKVALATDAKVADLFPAIVAHFVKAEVKSFSFNEYEDALEWINKGGR